MAKMICCCWWVAVPTDGGWPGLLFGPTDSAWGRSQQALTDAVSRTPPPTWPEQGWRGVASGESQCVRAAAICLQGVLGWPPALRPEKLT